MGMSRMRRALAMGVIGGGAQTYQDQLKALPIAACWPLTQPLIAAGAGGVKDIGAGSCHGAIQAGSISSFVAGPVATENVAVFNGSTFCRVFSAGLASRVNLTEGAMMIWFQGDAALWTDGEYRELFDLADTSGEVSRYNLTKDGAANKIYANVRSNSSNVYLRGVACSATTWQWFYLSWSQTNNRYRLYLNNAKQGADAAFTAWTTALQRADIGANGAGSTAYYFVGALAYPTIFTRELTDAELAIASRTPA